MRFKRSKKRCFLFLAFFVAVTVLTQNAIVILVSFCDNSFCYWKLGSFESLYPRAFDHFGRSKSPRVVERLVSRFQTDLAIKNDSLVREEDSKKIAAKTNKCEIPEDLRFPLCSFKVKSFPDSWNPKCHDGKYRVDLYDRCSVIQYLSEVEAWCPVLPWRQDQDPFKPSVNQSEAKTRTDVSGLLQQLADDRYAWMRIRITETWPQWVEAVKELAISQGTSERKKKKIVLYMGSLEFNFKIFMEAFNGGVLGELSQWSDVMSALYILGHDLVITSDRNDLPNIITTPDPDGCASKILNDRLDLIFTDIIGVAKFSDASGPHQSRYRCKIRVLDSFGSDAEFNFEFYKENIPGGRSVWGNLNLLLPQFMTMYPHSPDNSFVGFAVPNKKHLVHTTVTKMGTKALVYGKMPHFWEGKRHYLDIIKKYFHEVHANIGTKNESELRKYEVPGYIVNHGIVNITTLLTLFQSSKVFVGLGMPFEGPAALEALANGCFFINPKFTPAYDRRNHGFFAGKPMDRKITSQNPYAEVFIGEPFVQTVDINDQVKVEEAVKNILESKTTPHLPYEFTVLGMLERLNAYVEYQDFCRPNDWPPIKELRTAISKDGQSCVFACLDKGLVCEPTFFPSINTQDALKRAEMPCNVSTIESRDSILAPSMKTADSTCMLQSETLLFSCRAAKPGVVRVCPCRSYRKEQVALCESCLGS